MARAVQGLANFKFNEFIEIIFRDLGLLFFSGFDFKRIAAEETLKYFRARAGVPGLDFVGKGEVGRLPSWGKPGIRAQLLNIKSRKLEMDFVIEGDEKSLHVLNAVSPAWTCALPFATHVCDRIDGLKASRVL